MRRHFPWGSTIDESTRKALTAVTPVAKPARSPFTNVTRRGGQGVTSKDLLQLVREGGRARGARGLRSPGTARIADVSMTMFAGIGARTIVQ